MNPLQYFDEEYNSFQESISQIDSLLYECRDIVSSSSQVQKRIRELHSSKALNISDVSELLQSVSKILEVSSLIINSVDQIKNHLILNTKESSNGTTA